MSLIASTPRGFSLAGWRAVAGVTLGWCLAPALLAGLGWMVLQISGPDRIGPDYPGWEMLAVFFALSPLITGPVWGVIGAGAAWGMQHGAYGSLSAALLGALAGFGAEVSTGIPLLAPLGAAFATFHRFTLALIRPGAF